MSRQKLDGRKVASKFVAEINEAEMACRIFEMMSGIDGQPRPYPTSPEKSMEFIKQQDPLIYGRVRKAARAAIEYLGECVSLGREPS